MMMILQYKSVISGDLEVLFPQISHLSPNHGGAEVGVDSPTVLPHLSKQICSLPMGRPIEMRDF